MPKKPTREELEKRIKALEEESIHLKIDLKLMERELQDKNNHLQSILNSADGFAIYRLVVDAKEPYLLRATFVSPSIKKILGCEAENFSSLTFFSNIHPDDLERVERANRKAFETNRFDEVCRYYNPIKKQWVWIHAISTGVVNDEGQITHVNGIFIDLTEQRKAEESLQRSEEHLRTITKSATNFAVYQLSSNEASPYRLKVEFVSPSVKDLLSIPKPMKFETWFENLHPEDVKRIEKANQRAFRTLRFDEEFRIYNREKGQWRWIHVISTGGVDQKGWNKYVNGILIDITDRKQAEKALRESEEHFRKLAEGSFEAIALHDNGVILEANKQYYETFGYAPEELAGKDAISLTATPESISKVREQISLGNLGPYEITGLKKDGTKFPLEVLIKLTRHKGKRVRIAVFRDLTRHKEMEEKLLRIHKELEQRVGERTAELLRINEKLETEINERRKSENALRKSRHFLQNLFNNTFQFIGLLNTEGILLEANRASLDFYGISESDVLGMPFWETPWWDHSPEQQNMLQEAIRRCASGEFVRFETSHPAPDGILHIIDTSIKPLQDETGKVNLLIAEGRDITDLKTIEAQLRAAAREKDLLLQEVHHRVKNNFEIISSLLDMSSRQGKKNESQSILRDVRAKIISMALIHSQLYEADRFDYVDMGTYAHNLIGHLAIAYTEIAEAIEKVVESSDVHLQLNQALPAALALNELISNVFKHAFRKKRKGAIAVTIQSEKGGKVLLKVKDNGDGIPEGTDIDDTKGFGIKLVRNLVEGQLRGKMTFRSDHGTECCIEFRKNK